jgi:hypothetical protein
MDTNKIARDLLIYIAILIGACGLIFTYRLLIVRLQVRVLPGSPKRTHPEPNSVPIEQFLAMLCFDQRDKLADLPIDLNRSGRDDFV